MVSQSYIVLNSLHNILLGNTSMKFTLTLDTDKSLLANLNSVEGSLRENGLLNAGDSLIAITDNPLDPSSVTIGSGITVSALGKENMEESGETLSFKTEGGETTTVDNSENSDL